jgi:hypothetical protein
MESLEFFDYDNITIYDYDSIEDEEDYMDSS